jgi:hypothetical protein
VCIFHIMLEFKFIEKVPKLKIFHNDAHCESTLNIRNSCSINESTLNIKNPWSIKDANSVHDRYGTHVLDTRFRRGQLAAA